MIEKDGDQVEIDNVMKDLQKTLELDFFGWVPIESTQRPAPEHNAPTIENSQGNKQENSSPIAGSS